MAQDPLVELSRVGTDPLEFKLSEITPLTVANVFHVSAKQRRLCYIPP